METFMAAAPAPMATTSPAPAMARPAMAPGAPPRLPPCAPSPCRAGAREAVARPPRGWAWRRWSSPTCRLQPVDARRFYLESLSRFQVEVKFDVMAVVAEAELRANSVALGTRTGEASVLYVTVPREDSNVYRQAQVKNPLAAPMLPGPAEVYVGGEYVLSTQYVVKLYANNELGGGNRREA